MANNLNIKDYMNKILNEASYYRELGLERIEVTVKNIDNKKSFMVVIPKPQIKYRGVEAGDKLFMWWRRIDEDKKPNLKLLEKEVNRKMALINKIKTDLTTQRKVNMQDFNVDIDEQAEKEYEKEKELVPDKPTFEEELEE